MESCGVAIDSATLNKYERILQVYYIHMYVYVHVYYDVFRVS